MCFTIVVNYEAKSQSKKVFFFVWNDTIDVERCRTWSLSDCLLIHKFSWRLFSVKERKLQEQTPRNKYGNIIHAKFLVSRKNFRFCGAVRHRRLFLTSRSNLQCFWACYSSTLTLLREFELEIIILSAGAIFALSYLDYDVTRSSLEFVISTSLIDNILSVEQRCLHTLRSCSWLSSSEGPLSQWISREAVLR